MSEDKAFFKIISRNDRRRLRDMLPLGKPLSIFIEPTNVCNFRCLFCIHGSDQTLNDLKPLKHMDIRLFEKIVQDIKAWKGPKLKLLRLAVLGEPLAHPQFVEMVKLAKEADIAERVDTFSNGSLLTEAISEKLIDYGLDYIRFSIYSVLNERHRQVTQTDFDINRIRENIAALHRIKVKKRSATPYILAKMFDTYSEENDLFIEKYKGIVDEIGFEKVHDGTKYTENNLIKAYYQNEKLEEMTRNQYEINLNQLTVCPRPFMALVINNLGDVVMCTHDAPKATKIGNVAENTLENIWNSDELFAFRKMHLEGKKKLNYLCRNCDWFRLFPAEDSVDGFPIEKLRPQRR